MICTATGKRKMRGRRDSGVTRPAESLDSFSLVLANLNLKENPQIHKIFGLETGNLRGFTDLPPEPCQMMSDMQESHIY